MKKISSLLLSVLLFSSLVVTSCGDDPSSLSSTSQDSNTTSQITSTDTSSTSLNNTTSHTTSIETIDDYDSYIDQFSEENHLYIHYYREGFSFEDYNNYGIWLWPRSQSGVLFANQDASGIVSRYPGWVSSIGNSSSPVDQAGVMLDIDLTKDYITGKSTTISVNFLNEKRLGFLVIELDSIGGGSHWVSDGGADTYIDIDENAIRDNGSIHLFIKSGNVSNPTFYYDETTYTNPIVSDTTGKYESESDLNSSNDPNIYNPSTSSYFKESGKIGYHIFVPTFCDSNDDGWGDLRGIINKMDYLVDDLHVDTLWLSPFLKSNSYHGYDTVDYYQVDDRFGSFEDLLELIHLCHENGVKIMMDLVINHASTSSEWFKKAQRGETGVDSKGNEFNYRNLFHFKYKGSKTHYYENQNGNYVKVEVNVEDSQDWIRDGESNYYYYAKFGTDMPEFNYDYQATRDFIVEMAKFYLGLGIDGFRMDAIKHIYMENETENSSSDVINYDTGNRSYWDEQKEEFVTESYDYSTNSTKNIIFWKEFSAKLKASYPNCFITGENLDGWDERVAPYYESMDSQLDFCNYYDIQNYLYANTGYTASMLANQVNDKNAVFKEYRSDFINTAFTSNHDLLRAINHINANKEGETGVEENVVINGSAQQLNRAKIYAAITLLQPGISFIYYGDELGMSSNTTENELDHENHIDRYYRQSFKWDDESERPLINIGEVDNSYDSYNEKLDTLSQQQEDPNSVWSFYQDICEIKARDDFPADGNMTAYSYNLNADTFYYVIEPSNSSQSRYRVWINTGGRSGNSGDASYSLESGEEVIYKYNATDSSISPYGIVVAVM